MVIDAAAVLQVIDGHLRLTLQEIVEAARGEILRIGGIDFDGSAVVGDCAVDISLPFQN